jgi:hypothetical protein
MAVVTTGKLNTVNDTYIGGGTSGDRYPGQLGQLIELSEVEAQKMDSALHAGVYQYVKFKAGTTASNAKGQGVVWSDFDAFEVSPDVTAALSGLFAGVALNAVSKGSYGWIQVAGVATLLCNSSVGGTTAGDLAVLDATAATFSAIADATAASTDTALEVKRIVGNFIEAPANSGLKLAAIKGGIRN